MKVIGTGWVASAGAHIFLAAKKDNRYCTTNTRFLLHQPMGGVGGQATDIEIEAKEILKMRERSNRIIAEGDRPAYRARRQGHRPQLLDGPEEAKDYGVVTHVVDTMNEVK